MTVHSGGDNPVTPSTHPIAPVTPLATDRLAVRPLGLAEVELRHGFWADWQRLNRATTIPHALVWLERDGSVDNLRDHEYKPETVPASK